MKRPGGTKYLLFTTIILCCIYWTQRLFIDISGRSSAINTGLARETDEIELDHADSHASSVQQHDLELQNSLSSHSSSPLLPEGYTAAFPRHIWQTSSEAGRKKYENQSQTWRDVKGFQYHWLSDEEADFFVHTTFAIIWPSLVEFWNDLSSGLRPLGSGRSVQHASVKAPALMVDSTASSAIVLRADLLRYMLMYAEGGVYADIDTSVLLHIDRWIPEQLGSQVVNAIIGIEYDDKTYKMFVRPISFCQWTLMSKPGHTIFARAIKRVMSNLEFLARRQKVASLSQLKLDKLDVLEATGPGMISDVVLEVIRDQNPEKNITWATFHGQRDGILFGDVLILPINAFAGNQKHSHAGDPLYGEKLVQHHFGRSWYRPSKSNVGESNKL